MEHTQEHTQTGELNSDFRTCLAHLMEHGADVQPRGAVTKELLNYNITLFDPRNRIVNFVARKTSAKYLLAEFIWYLSGSNDPAGILPYSKFWNQIRNTGDMPGYSKGTINSNYGYRLFGQDTRTAVPYLETAMTPAGIDETGKQVINPHLVTYPRGDSQWNSTIKLLTTDKDSRQAIMNIHLPEDRHTGNLDVPCTSVMQWFIRENQLHLIVTMRSNDIVLGFTNDVFQFTMLQECMLLQLREVYPELELGFYYHNAGSMHIYDRHFKMAEEITKDEQAFELPMIAMDCFNEVTMKNLVQCEQSWRAAGSSSEYNFELLPEFKALTVYWQNLLKFCFTEDHAAMHKMFRVAESIGL